MKIVIADSLLQMFSPVESNPYPALACIRASAEAAAEALRSNSTRKSCISHPDRSCLKVKEDITRSISCSHSVNIPFKYRLTYLTEQRRNCLEQPL